MCRRHPDDAGGAQSGEAGCRARVAPRGHVRPTGARMRAPDHFFGRVARAPGYLLQGIDVCCETAPLENVSVKLPVQ